MSIRHAAVWTLCAAAVGGILIRPRGIPEWVWAIGGAACLAAFGLVSLPDVVAAVGRGTDVYLFLTGMMVLAEVARRAGVFDWVADRAVAAARGSRFRLFVLVYGVGIVVTIVLSNDATAVVLTPAVAAAVRKADAEPLPYLFACALIANAASFVLPISNPANLVVFARAMPPLVQWLWLFTIPSVVAIGITFGVLALLSRRDLRGALSTGVAHEPLTRTGRLVIIGITVTALGLVIAAARNAPLGATTFGCGAIVLAIVSLRERAALADVARSVTWSVLALVAGLFVLVQGLDGTGLLTLTRRAVEALAQLPPSIGVVSAAAVTALGSNVVNNLPAGLIAGSSVAPLHGHEALRAAVAIGIDLGPNLSVTGSLATVLWLIALRREKIDVTPWRFLQTGTLVMPPALVLAALSVLIAAR